jgi:uncharacterized protein YeaO (DUF488 family)
VDLWTARIGYRGADGLDITRKSATMPGLVLAPSWDLLSPFLHARKERGLTAEDWTRYSRLYRDEMRDSFARWSAEWRTILARPEITLLCYCADASRCHRSLAASLIVAASKGGALPVPKFSRNSCISAAVFFASSCGM